MPKSSFQQALILLSTSTAVPFDPSSTSVQENSFHVRVQLSIDDVIINGILADVDEEQFLYEKFAFHVKHEFDECGRRLVVWVTSPNAEWNLLYQIRIKTNAANSATKVVNWEMFEFFTCCRPLSVNVLNEVAIVKFELRTINKQYLEHPLFTEGDIAVYFSDGSSIRTWRALLSIASEYMAHCCADKNVDCLDVGDFPKEEFCELLYQLYPTRRPIWGNFRGLTRAALAFKCNTAIYAVSKHLLDKKPMSLEERLHTALKLELYTVVEELLFRAVQSGVWGHMINLGFEPQHFFTQPIYRNIVCPTITEARKRDVMDSTFRDPFVAPDYFCEEAKLDVNNRSVLFRGTPFYVNRGILAVHGTEAFGISDNDDLVAMFSRQMQIECATSKIVPSDALVSLFNSLYPGGPVVEAQFLRVAIVFCHDHNWMIAKENLEQLLVLEPAVSTEHYLEQRKFAEMMQLENLLRNCIYRAEASCNEFAMQAISMSDCQYLSIETRDKTIDRMYSGWALQSVSTSESASTNQLGLSSPLSSQTSSSDRRVCRICFSETGKMVRPCGCTGTMGDVHSYCLSKWVDLSNKSECEICHEHYANSGRKFLPLKQWSKPQIGIWDALVLFLVVFLWCLIFYYHTWYWKTYLKKDIETANLAYFVVTMVITLIMAIRSLVAMVDDLLRYVEKQTKIRFVNKGRISV